MGDLSRALLSLVNSFVLGHTLIAEVTIGNGAYMLIFCNSILRLVSSFVTMGFLVPDCLPQSTENRLV